MKADGKFDFVAPGKASTAREATLPTPQAKIEVWVPSHGTHYKRYNAECEPLEPHFTADQMREYALLASGAADTDLRDALRNMVLWLDDGNRELSEECARDVADARAALDKANRKTTNANDAGEA